MSVSRRPCRASASSTVVSLDVNGDNGRAFALEHRPNGRAEAAGRAGHDRNPSLELSTHRFAERIKPAAGTVRRCISTPSNGR
jgi:hypothetical protein